jgi:hypothetical protein
MMLVGEKISNPASVDVVTKHKTEDAEAYVKAKKEATDKAIEAKRKETGDAIRTKKNEIAKAIKEKENETTQIIENRTNDIDNKVWNKTKIFSLSSIALLLISIGISAFLRYLAPVIILFVCAIAGLVFSQIFYKKMRDEIEKDTATKNTADELALKEYVDALNAECNACVGELNAACEQRVKELNDKCNADCKAYTDKATLECKNYKNERRKDVLTALNAKLVSLGMPPASVSEYSV